MFGARFGSVIFLFFSLNAYSLGQVTYETGNLSSPRKGIASVVVDDLIYFAGGLEREYQASKAMDIYDTINGNWSTTTLPQARGYITTMAVDPNIYFIGGSDWINIPYVYSTTLRDFVPLANMSGPTVHAPIQLKMLNSTLVVVGRDSVDFFDINTLEWSYSEELTSLMAQYSSANVIVAEEVVILISPVQSTSAWVYDTRTRNLTEWKNVLDTFSSTMTQSEGSNGVVFMVFPDKCVLYNVAKNAWRTFNTASIRYVTHIGDYSYVLGETLFADNWNGSAPVTLTDTPFEYASSFGSYIVLFHLSIFRLFTPGLQYYSTIQYLTTSTTFTIGVAWGNDKFAVVDSAMVVVLDIGILYYTTYGPFNPMPVDLRVFVDDRLFVFLNSPDGYLVAITSGGDMQEFLPSFMPRYIVEDQFLSLRHSFTLEEELSDFSTNFNENSTLATQNGNTLVAMLKLPSQVFYKAMDIYNYKTGAWVNGTVVPEELFPTANTTSPVPFTFMASAIVNDEIYIWHLDTFAVYNTTEQLWTTSNSTVQIHPFYGAGNIFTPEPSINNASYIYTFAENYFYKFDHGEDLTWTPTSSVDEDTKYYFAQRVIYNDKIYALRYDTENSKYESIYNYNPVTDGWDLTILPTSVSYASMAIGGDYLIVMTTNSTLFYLSIPTGQWVTVQDFPYNFIPSTAIVSNSKLVIGGGFDPVSATFTDLVLLFDISTFVVPPVAANQTNQPVSSSTIEGPIIVAIVVPIVAVVAAGVVVLIVLIRRCDKKGKKSMSMVGLEAKYGQWFIPFSDIQFGDQLGQGANGQVFEGRWNNTQVALKVSMTQANMSVISELSLMINMRPHPNIVQLFGFSVHPETNSIILVLEYCNERSLSAVLFDSVNEIEMAKKILWIKGVARGISHLHSNNIVHRDIAARNILLHNNEVKVTDFGMSRLVEEQQQRGTTKSELGPIRWMAPEALKNKEYSVKSDVWSFSILMYEVIIQQEPHVNEDPITIGRLIRDEGKTPEIPSTCPPALATLMQHCWKMNPDQRPSFDKLLQLLDV